MRVFFHGKRFPFYRVERGKQKGTLKGFLFVSRGEYDGVGYKAAKRIEYDRIRSRRVAITLPRKLDCPLDVRNVERMNRDSANVSEPSTTHPNVDDGKTRNAPR